MGCGCQGGFGSNGGFDPAAFEAYYPSLFWHHAFLPAYIANPGQAGMAGEKAYAASPNNVEYYYNSFDQNEETIQWDTSVWCAPFNWDPTANLKVWAYWYTESASHGVANDLEWHIRGISDGDTLTFNQTYTLNADTDLAVNVMYITPILTITPTTASSLKVRDFLHIMFRRGNDAASGAIRTFGYQVAWKIDPTIAVP